MNWLAFFTGWIFIGLGMQLGKCMVGLNNEARYIIDWDLEKENNDRASSSNCFTERMGKKGNID